MPRGLGAGYQSQPSAVGPIKVLFLLLGVNGFTWELGGCRGSVNDPQYLFQKFRRNGGHAKTLWRYRQNCSNQLTTFKKRQGPSSKIRDYRPQKGQRQHNQEVQPKKSSRGPRDRISR